MNKLNDFQEAIKYVGGAGCLMMMGVVVIVIMMIESHLRLAKLAKSDKDMRTEKLLARLFELVLVSVVIFTGHYLFVHYL